MGACCSGGNNELEGNEKDGKKPTEEEKDKEITAAIETINVTKMYNFGETLGAGASCRVVQATNKKDIEDQVAIKIMDKDKAISEKLYNREVSMLERLTPNRNKPHSSILPFVGHGDDEDSFYIVTRLLWGGELFDRIVSKDENYKITEKVAVKLVCSMLKAVKYCHDQGVVHRDLKPENFVFANKRTDSDIVLIDFGCARIVEDDEVIDDVVGTAYYLAPELASAALENYVKKGQNLKSRAPPSKPRNGKVLKAADVWSMGVISYVMMTGRAPFRGSKGNAGIFEASCTKPLLFPEKDARYQNKLILSDHFKDFCKKTMTKDPAERISIEDAIRHPWVQGVGASDFRLNQDVIHYLRQFKYQSKLKKEITRILAQNMTSEPSKQVLRHFNRLDADGDGFLDLKELTYLLLDMGYAKNTAEPEAVKIMHHADINKDGVVDFEEFKQVWYRKVLTTNDQYIHRVFDVFDDNGDGDIDAEELKTILFPELADGDDQKDDENEQELETQETDMDDGFLQTVSRMIAEVDKDGDGKISFEEFKDAMTEDLDSGKFAFGKSEEDKWGGLIGPKL